MIKLEEQLILVYTLVLHVIIGWKVVLAHSRLCSHVIPSPREVVHSVPLGHNAHHSLRKRSVTRNLRIHLVYDKSVEDLDEAKRVLATEDVIPKSVAFWEKTLKVRHSVSPIRLLRQCRTEQVKFIDGDPFPYCFGGCQNVTKCGYNVVPAKHLERCREARSRGGFKIFGTQGKGASNADFILYVSAYETDRCSLGTTVAYAAYCQLEDATDRPVAGYVNLCPESFSTSPHELHQVQSTIKHEILHALGFSAGLFAFFRDDLGQPLTPRSPATGKPHFNDTLNLYQWNEKVVKTVNIPNWSVKNGLVAKTAHFLVTPRVVKEVRRHFNCNSLIGAELEDQGIVGTSLTHWEKRLFESEVMTGTHTQNAVISRLTLALMEDTGWYRADYSQAGELTWGKNLGCEFANSSCLQWISSRRKRGESIHPFCDRVKGNSLRTECTHDLSAVALCNLIEYEDDLPLRYQHFHNISGVLDSNVARFAGSVMLADYCPYIQEFSWKDGDVVVRGTQCNIPHNTAGLKTNYLVESYGNQSKCFFHHRPFTLTYCNRKHVVEHWGSGCYQYRCDVSLGLILILDGMEHQCTRSGDVISFSAVTKHWLHSGQIVCPPCTVVCRVCPGETKPMLQSSQINPIELTAPCDSAVSNYVHFANSLTLWLLLLVFKTIYMYNDV